MDRAVKRDLFWNMYLNGYQQGVLKRARFTLPEQLLDMPIVFLNILDGFGFPCVLDTISALYEYLELSKDEEIREELEELFNYVSDDEDENEETDTERENELLVDDIFYVLGYNTPEKITQITIRELFNMKGAGLSLLQSVAEEVIKTYYKIYVPPRFRFHTKYDFKENGYLVFKLTRHQQYLNSIMQ